MKIHENAALLDAFVDGELTAAEMAEVQAHLAECPGCQAEALTMPPSTGW